jgi:phage terminase large subunit-like protein
MAGVVASCRPWLRQDENRRRAGKRKDQERRGAAGGARRRDRSRCAQCDGRGRIRPFEHRRSGAPAVLGTVKEAADLAERGDCDGLQRRGTRTPARTAARFRVVRRTRRLALPGRDLGHADVRVAARRRSARRGDDDAAPDPARPRAARRSRRCGANLPPAFIQQIIRRYEGTRLGRQELEAELLDDVPGALWTREAIERGRAGPDAPLDLTRVVVAVDPAVTSGEDSDETGIVIAGKDDSGHGWVLADLSGRYMPTDWARRAIAAYREHRADRVVAEVNQGGEMVEATLRMIDPEVSFAAVRASRGKIARAEPVAALYEQGRIHHVGTFPQLEDQMCAFTADPVSGHGAGFDRSMAGYSPDRVDALVWALSALLVEPIKGQGIYDLYRRGYRK